MVVSFTGSPPAEKGLKQHRQTPVRCARRPVSKAARAGVQAELAVWKSVKRRPFDAKLSRSAPNHIKTNSKYQSSPLNYNLIPFINILLDINAFFGLTYSA